MVLLRSVCRVARWVGILRVCRGKHGLAERVSVRLSGFATEEGVVRMALTFDEICIDARDALALGAWWSKVLGWRHYVGKDGDVVLDAPPGAGPNWLFIDVPDDKVVKNRIHLDFRPEDQQAEVDRLIGL